MSISCDKLGTSIVLRASKLLIAINSVFAGTAIARMSSSSSSSAAALNSTKPTLFFFHGLGDCGASWQGQLASVFPHLHVNCPTAPSQPVTYNNGYRSNSWFDISNLDMSTPEDEDGIKAAAKNVHKLVEAREKQGVPSGKIMLGGFSQGGALALYSALTYPKKLAGVVALSCWLPLHQQFPKSLCGANKDVPIFQAHGETDLIVALEHAEATHAVLRKFLNKDQVRLKIYKDVGHGLDSEELSDVKKFVERHLPQA